VRDEQRQIEVRPVEKSVRELAGDTPDPTVWVDTCGAGVESDSQGSHRSIPAYSMGGACALPM